MLTFFLKCVNINIVCFLLYEKEGKTYAMISATNLNVFTENDFLNIVQATKNLKADFVYIISQKFDNFNTKILKNIEYNLLSKEKLFKDLMTA